MSQKNLAYWCDHNYKCASYVPTQPKSKRPKDYDTMDECLASVSLGICHDNGKYKCIKFPGSSNICEWDKSGTYSGFKNCYEACTGEGPPIPTPPTPKPIHPTPVDPTPIKPPPTPTPVDPTPPTPPTPKPIHPTPPTPKPIPQPVDPTPPTPPTPKPIPPVDPTPIKPPPTPTPIKPPPTPTPIKPVDKNWLIVAITFGISVLVIIIGAMLYRR